MRRNKHRRASIDEVRITREAEGATIVFVGPTMPTAHLRLGLEVAKMSDASILDTFNRMIDARDELAAGFEHKVVEIPIGKQQIAYSVDTDQWVPRGSVLRCHIEDDEHGELVVQIDDKELDLHAFGQMLRTYAGWGMRIYFVDDDAVAEEPALEIRDPNT